MASMYARLAAKARLPQHMGKFWTVANMLSLCRVVLAIPIALLILRNDPDNWRWLMGLILLAVLTDWMDGRVARWTKSVSDWGKVLDPLADKFMAAMVTLALVIRESLPAWFLGLILLRDVLIIFGGVVVTRKTGKVLMSIWSGKVAVTALAITVVAALLYADPPVMRFCIWTTAVLMIYSWALYLIRALAVIRAHKQEAALIGDGERFEAKDRGTDAPRERAELTR